MHYYEYFQWLCRIKGVKESEAYNGCGINRSSVSRWRSAFEEGKEMKMSAKAATGIARYFGLPIKNVFDKLDEYGLSESDWKQLGSRISAEIDIFGKSIEDISAASKIPVEDIDAFIDGTPLQVCDVDALAYACGSSPRDLYGSLYEKLRKNTPTQADERDLSEFEYAAHQYDGELTEEDKATLISLMKKFAAANKTGGENGAFN